MYALNLADDGRILSITDEKYGALGQPLVESFPEGNVRDYRYLDGQFVHDPLPPEPVPEEGFFVTEAELDALVEDKVNMVIDQRGGTGNVQG